MLSNLIAGLEILKTYTSGGNTRPLVACANGVMVPEVAYSSISAGHRVTLETANWRRHPVYGCYWYPLQVDAGDGWVPGGGGGGGVPTGGTIDQVLAKNSSADFDTKWSDGVPGPAGPAGPAGAAGAAGVDGVDGVDGAIGPAGPAGAAGVDGVDGVDGAIGPAGPQGDPGPVGPAGPSHLTTKGDLLAYTTETIRLPVGTDTYVLTADSTAAAGFSWTPPSSGYVFDNTFSTGNVVSTGTYKVNFSTMTALSGIVQAVQIGVTAGSSDKIKVWLYNGDPDTVGTVLYYVAGPSELGYDISSESLDDRNAFWIELSLAGELYFKVENLAVTDVTLSVRVRVTDNGGVDGAKGDTGEVGPAGADGLGVPAGGTTGQVLAKASDADNDTAWVSSDPSEGGKKLQRVDTAAWETAQTGVVYHSPEQCGGFFGTIKRQFFTQTYTATTASPILMAAPSGVQKLIAFGGYILDAAIGMQCVCGGYISSGGFTAVVLETSGSVTMRVGSSFDEAGDSLEVWVDYVST